MIPENIDKWYCCLNPAEQTAFQVCAGNAGPITYFVVGALFDAVWLLAFEGSASNRKEVFIANNGLTEGQIPPEDPDGMKVYYLDQEFWDLVNAYFDEHGVVCDEPCKIREFRQ